MAQPNHGMNPAIHFSHIDEVGYDNQTPQYAQDVYFSQWNYSDPRTIVQSVPSPTNTVNTIQTVPLPRDVARMNVAQSKRLMQQSQYDPNLQYLMPPGARGYSLNRNVDQIVDPITRLCGSEGPWNPHQMRNSNVDVSHNTLQHPQADFNQYRQSTRSEGDNASDSGYQTQTARSVLSNEPGHGGQDLPVDFMLQTENMNVNVVPNASHDMVRTMSDQVSVSQQSSRSGDRKQQFPCLEPGCNVVNRCASELKRHMLKHEKNFICSEPHCRRGGKGFSTINDLARHKKSVHKIGVEASRSYQCAAAGCASKTKIWPRLDNFKQHLERMHGRENMLELIKRSEYNCQETPSLQQSFSLDPALLAGIGNSNDNLSSSGNQAFPYQPSASFHTSSFSSASQMSPGAASTETSFSKLNESSNQSRSSLVADDHMMLSSDSLATIPHKRRKLNKESRSDATSTLQVAPSSSNTAPPLQLSNDPQTKSEQQRHALEKLTKAMHVRGDQLSQDDSRGNASLVLSDGERRLLADLLKEQSKSIRQQQRRSTQGSASSVGYCDFGDCDFFGRPCDLKKHKKRHQRPYGCTYPKCEKRFGAKSDWKRHENSQHFQREAYRCDILKSTGKKCGHHCYRSDRFQEHLAGKHRITVQQQVETSLKRCKIGKNYQDQYWCGFCCGIKPLEKKRNDAWDERFNHIAFHFEKEKMSIDDWLCVEEDVTKKEFRRISGKYGIDEEQMDVDADGDNDDEVPSGREATSAWAAQSNQQGSMQAQASIATTQRPERRKEQIVLRECCQCFCAYSTVQVHCFGCRHDLCDHCKHVHANPDTFGDDNLM